MAIIFEIDTAKLKDNAAILRWYSRFAAAALREAQLITTQRIESRSGTYERSFDFVVIPGNPPKLLFGNKAPFAIHLEEGTDDHFVKPVNAKALRWFENPGAGSAGNPIFSKGHKVSGIKAKNIVRDAVSNTGNKLPRSLF